MRGLIVDYRGVLDGSDEERGNWHDLLSAIHANEVGIVVLSNDEGGPDADPIRALGTLGLVDDVVLSGEIGVEKPEAEAFLVAADRLDLDPRDCVLVDDSIINVRAAVGVGMVGVFYQTFDRAAVEIRELFGVRGEE